MNWKFHQNKIVSHSINIQKKFLQNNIFCSLLKRNHFMNEQVYWYKCIYVFWYDYCDCMKIRWIFDVLTVSMCVRVTPCFFFSLLIIFILFIYILHFITSRTTDSFTYMQPCLYKLNYWIIFIRKQQMEWRRK